MPLWAVTGLPCWVLSNGSGLALPEPCSELCYCVFTCLLQPRIHCTDSGTTWYLHTYAISGLLGCIKKDWPEFWIKELLFILPVRQMWHGGFCIVMQQGRECSDINWCQMELNSVCNWHLNCCHHNYEMLPPWFYMQSQYLLSEKPCNMMNVHLCIKKICYD